MTWWTPKISAYLTVSSLLSKFNPNLLTSKLVAGSALTCCNQRWPLSSKIFGGNIFGNISSAFWLLIGSKWPFVGMANGRVECSCLGLLPLRARSTLLFRIITGVSYFSNELAGVIISDILIRSFSNWFGIWIFFTQKLTF